MQKLPKISIITPTFNSEKDIEACILSVANQTYENKEHLIIDGLSTDGTLEIIKKYAAKYPHIRWISENDEGIYDAMNKGIDMASGEWLYFIGSDDVFFEKNVLKEIFSVSDISENDVIYGNVAWGDTGKSYDGEFTLLKLLDKNICHQAIFAKRDIFDKIGKFNLKYKTRADWEINLKLFANCRFNKKYLPKIISKYNINGMSSTCIDTYYIENRLDIVKSIVDKDFFVAYQEIVNLRNKIMERKDVNKNKIEYEKILKNKEEILKNKEDEIRIMKSSKFWKLRNFYLKIKKHLRS